MHDTRTRLVEMVVMFFIPVAALVMLNDISLEDAKLFPKTICYVMLAFAAVNAVQVLMTWRKAAAARGGSAPFPAVRVGLALGMIGLYALTMEAVGFYLAGFLFFLLAMLVLDPGRPTPAAAGRKAFCALCFMAVLYLLFNTMLGVMTPRGIWM